MKSRFSKLSKYPAIALSVFALTGLVVATDFSSPGLYITQPEAYPLPDYHPGVSITAFPVDTPTTHDSLKFPFDDRIADPMSLPYDHSPLYLNDPSNIKTNVEYDPDNNQYNVNEMIGGEFYRNPSYLTYDEYVRKTNAESTKKYWQQLSEGGNSITGKKGLNPKLYVGSEAFERIFGTNTIDIRPQGSAELTFGANIATNKNPGIPVKQQRTGTFDFKEKIQLNVVGNIGDKMKLSTNYNTEASFDFENKMKLEYTGHEDEIIKKIEAGNVSLPLTGTLITGSQSLFGFKAQLQFGKLMVTGLFSEQKGKSQNIVVPPGGGQKNDFEITCDNYEANKHFFIAQYFRDHYDQALKNAPVISTPITITKIEVWVVKPGLTDTRSLIGFMDLGEASPYSSTSPIVNAPLPPPTTPLPDNNANSIYYNFNDTGQTYHNLRNPAYTGTTAIYTDLANNKSFTAPRDYERIENAVKLQPSEYTFNSQLGYVSLKSQLNPNQVLAVAYEYSYNGTVYRVGDLTTAGISPPNRLYVKILKSSNVSVKLPIWKLMMKNIYALGAYGLQQKDFKLNVLYYNDSTGSDINFLPAGASEPNVNSIALIKVLNLDRLNSQLDPQPDGIFDYVEGLTVDAADGRIIFPEVEPFGSYLKSKFNPNTNVYQKFVFQELYDSSKTAAQQIPEKNKYKLKGSYVSNVSSDIALNAINIPQGSVKVTAGGIPLTENVDYTVDYNLGRVKIINQSYLNSASPINISLESNSLFSIQSKRLMGLHVDYLQSKDFTLGGTILNLTERPLTQKTNIGDEPISNTIIGVDGNYRTDSRFITKLIDKLPLIATKEVSSVTMNGEYAHFFPGHPKVIGQSGTAYIDDFEGTQSNIDLTTAGSWYLASVPQNQPTLFPETNSPENRVFGVNRAKLAWYQVDPTVFYHNSSLKPANITDVELQNNQVREVFDNEIFPQKSYPNGVVPPLRVLNLAYYPDERGPYNYDVTGVTGMSSGIDINGKLNNPESRWGGIMRHLETNDFEAANVEFITFWIMDPFNEDNPDPDNKGKLYFNLGQVSEDILHDGQRMYENGLPSSTLISETAKTDWGVYPTNTTNPTNAFDNDPNSRTQQDIGLDGLRDNFVDTFSVVNEHNFRPDSTKLSFLDSIVSVFGASSGAYTLANTDPSTDDFRFFRGNTTSDNSGSILYRYKDYNGTEANSPVASGNYSQSSTNQPDAEDISRDNNMDIYENYFQYEVDIDPAKMALGSQRYISDRVLAPVSSTTTPNKKVYWYQFKIPVSDFTRQVGEIQDFKSIGYIRMFMKGFKKPMVLRFGKLDLTRGEWRRYQANVGYGCESIDPQPFSNTTFDVGAVSIEENSGRTPINYVVPPGITRELNASTQQAQQLNEQSLSMRVCELFDGDGRATYKNTQLDLRSYKRIKMYAHCESIVNQPVVKDNDLTIFIRIGSDLTENFYEYEMPLKVSPLYNNNPTSIWPDSNNVDIDLSKFLEAKELRQQALLNPSTGITVKTFYPVMRDGEATIYVVGTPNLSEARSIMIGVRNPKQGCPQFPPYNNDDGLSKCAEVWVNELRLTDFDETGGWAANARIVTKLANLGTLSVSGRRSTYGFGMIEQKITERSHEDVTAYSVLSQLNLGKFFPDKWGIAVPFGFEYGEEYIKPQYDPLQPDVLFQQALDAEKANGNPKEFKRNRIDYTKRKGYNFSNVQKTRTGGGKSHLWDIENFNFTYAYTEVYHRNIDIQYDILKNYLGQIGYNFNTTIKPWEPFKKSKSLSSKWLRLIKDFNVTPLPSSLNFNTSINRQYGETLLRNNTSYQALIDTTFNKYWNWTRTYDIKWDLTKSVKLDFNALNTSKVDEPNGRIDNEEEKKIVRTNFWNGGRNTDYHQSGNASWQVPLSKIPILDWVQLNARYGFDYSWQAAPSLLDSATRTLVPNPILQNTIQNSNTKQLNGTLTFTQLYNKIPFFKKLLAPPAPAPGGKSIRPPKAEVPKAPGDTSKTVKPKVPGQINPVVKFVGKLILSVKSTGLTYSETNGTALPGYIPKTQFLGQDYNYKSASGSTSNAPGFGFTLGSQEDLRVKAARNNWLTTDTAFNSQYSKAYSQNFTGRSTIEPFDGMRIELSGQKNYSKSHTENYHINANTGEYNSYNALESGNFSISTIAWGTSFKKINKDYTNSTFDEFTKNRIVISQRLAADNPYSVGTDTAGYYDGYSGSNQEVISASFYAAYTGKDAATAKLNPLSLFPLPNWRITYDGFTKMKWSQKYFQNFQLTHSYRCTYNVNSYNTNLQYSDPFSTGHSPIRDLSSNFIPRYDIAQVSITESFAPLIGVDMTFKGKTQFNIRMDYKRDRNLSLTYTGVQLTEIRGNEFTFGTGYRISKLKLPFKYGGKKITLQNDLVLNFDFSYRKSLNVLRRMIEQTNIPSSGMVTYGIKFDADYQINDRFDVRFYWDTTINKPLIATSYPNSNTAFGFSVRFTLSQ
ncbi:MAG: cell surface protein SprA [Bacteroidia bacterium]